MTRHALLSRGFALSSLALIAASCGGEPDVVTGDTEQEVRAATLTLAPAPGSSTSFGTVVIGAAFDQSFVVTNAGTLQSSSAVVLSVNGADFSLRPPAAGECIPGTTTLRPGASCRVRVRFAPAAPVQRTATLSASATTGGTAGLSLAGNGVTQAVLTISPGSVAFGSTLLGTTSAASVLTVRNNGGGTTSVLNVALAGANPSDFAITSSTCTGVSLAANATCTIAVAFRPSIAGNRLAVLNVSATIGGTASATLTGTAVPPAQLMILPASFDFGSVPVGVPSAPATFTIINLGGAMTGPLAFALNSHDYTFQTSALNCGETLGAGQSCTLAVIFTPLATGTRPVTLQATALPGGTAFASLTGVGL